jgi:hypothetical protein
LIITILNDKKWSLRTHQRNESCDSRQKRRGKREKQEKQQRGIEIEVKEEMGIGIGIHKCRMSKIYHQTISRLHLLLHAPGRFAA